MKARMITLAIAITFSVTSIFASQPKQISNTKSTESGTVKEYILFNDYSEAIRRIDYAYNNEGKMQQRTTYKWDESKGWIRISKTVYTCDADQNLAMVVYTQWDKKAGKWNKNGEKTVYSTNNHQTLFVKNK